ncbi:uncharacterized protein TNCV_2567171 [Trichonephila clavipes]|uniref:Mutator-like transposase domain-containing protein n=1 Tax=Trichonephila clavipes TaxID=2585209 RepID=A0A8X6WKS8_TRICX|nr:uncharacterized protein TNCV_2567171 [Trichonephila clavipes]
MRSIGKGAEAGRMFCGVMNLPQPPTRFFPYGKRILNAAKLVYEDSIQNAAKEAICENEGNKNIAVAVDGTWQKRGYTSLNGVVTVTSIDTGKVIDVDILSKYCACKNLPFHEKDCKRNYVGSSGAMEIQGDGDCKAFDAVKKKNIYGNEYPIEKLECIGHVMKRMGTRLRRLKAQLKGQILSDGKCLSGKNRLTEHEIDNLQSYYGSAIRRNHSSVQNMRQAIWAIILHKLSTDEYPQHGFCFIGEDSWCGFKKAEALGKSYKHKNSLPIAVVEAMRPIFRDLSHPDLLKKCLHGKTQNPNESFHNVVWSRVPKATFVQIETLSLGVYDAVCSFNDGNVSKLKMLQKMGVEPGEFSVSAMKLLDRERLMKAIYAFSGRSKKIRKDKRRKRKKEEDNIKKNKADESNEEFNEYQIVIFCDSSERAYGAIACIRYKTNSDFHANFVSSKARVAPLKKLSLPRLELLATLIGGRLLETLRKVFKFTNNYIMSSDSTVAPSWIRGYAKQGKPFVSNRVHEIQDLTNPQNWRFVKGEQNPADIVSRGCRAEELLKNGRLWHGPHWLTLYEENWPKNERLFQETANEERRVKNIAINYSSEFQNAEPILDINNFSSISKVFRITA